MIASACSAQQANGSVQGQLVSVKRFQFLSFLPLQTFCLPSFLSPSLSFFGSSAKSCQVRFAPFLFCTTRFLLKFHIDISILIRVHISFYSRRLLLLATKFCWFLFYIFILQSFWLPAQVEEWFADLHVCTYAVMRHPHVAVVILFCQHVCSGARLNTKKNPCLNSWVWFSRPANQVFFPRFSVFCSLKRLSVSELADIRPAKVFFLLFSFSWNGPSCVLFLITTCLYRSIEHHQCRWDVWNNFARFEIQCFHRFFLQGGKETSGSVA